MSTGITSRAFHVLIAAAGSGARMGADIPKQYLPVAGKPLLRRTVENALSWTGVQSVRVIIDPKHAESYHDAVQGLDLPAFIAGGKTRCESVRKALAAIDDLGDDDLILIHDAARPFTRDEDVQALLAALDTHRAASLAVPVSDTLRRWQDIVERDGLWAVQTPQAFYYGDLKRAHAQADPDALHTDDTGLVSALGLEVKLVHGSRGNFKITTQDDFTMAQALFLQGFETRSGQGFDVHAFEDVPSGKSLTLCGITLDHPRALSGHSDADVGLHALTDAVLGAIGEGDIGLHFPPSDAQYKDMDSAVFLQKAVGMVRAKGGVLTHLDLTIICEAPKIGPHRDAMRARVAEICGIDEGRVNIKATTTEKLGFTGRGEGIAAQAIATVKMPVE